MLARSACALDSKQTLDDRHVATVPMSVDRLANRRREYRRGFFGPRKGGRLGVYLLVPSHERNVRL